MKYKPVLRFRRNRGKVKKTGSFTGRVTKKPCNHIAGLFFFKYFIPKYQRSSKNSFRSAGLFFITILFFSPFICSCIDGGTATVS